MTKQNPKRNAEFLFVVCLLLIVGLFVTFNDAKAQAVYTQIPKNSHALFQDVRSEQTRIFPESPIPFYIGGLIEQESCISLTHSKCWSAKSQLKTAREEGAGLFQITRAYTKTGGLRFDTLSDLRKKYPAELKELNWDKIYDRPDLQIRAGMLLFRDNYRALDKVPNAFERMAMADSAYNGGLGNLKKSRAACGLAKNCDPDIWFGNVERYLVQSKVTIYGNHSPFTINQEHVENAMTVRLWKYRPYIY